MILGTICVRGGSKGVRGKAMRFLAGKPLIAWTLLDAKFYNIFDDIVVSTDSSEIMELTLAVGHHQLIPMTRPAELATDTASKWDVFRWIAEQLPEYDTLVDLDVSCPLRAPEDITACITKLKESGADVVMTAYEAERNPYFNMVEDKGGWIDVVCNDYTDYHPTITRRQDAPPVYSLSPAVVAMRRDALFKYDHWSQSRLQIVIIPRSRAIDIDTEDDFRYVEWLMENAHD